MGDYEYINNVDWILEKVGCIGGVRYRRYRVDHPEIKKRFKNGETDDDIMRSWDSINKEDKDNE